MADLSGKTLGKYRLIERLGRGGMAEVYKGYQPSMDRYVAIKLMHGYLAEDEDFVKRFRREAKAIGDLRHPHIVQAYDFDIEDDLYYMVQEFVEGGTLKDRLREASERGERIPIEDTVQVFEAICDAVDYAHSKDRIHRDIKPDNIMFDATDRPVLTDFGIAAIVGGERFTATGAMVGTPAYMSPEQGKGDPNDPRSDIYSLGVVLYEMLTGRVPFDADTPFAVVLKHLNEALPMPRSINPELTPSIERVILRALAKAPEDRYQTACALAEDLKEAVSEPEPWAWEGEEAQPAPQAAAAVGTSIPGPPAGSVPADEHVTPPIVVAPGPPAAGALPASDMPQEKPRRRRKWWIWVVIAVAAVLTTACCLLALAAARENRGKRDLDTPPTAAEKVEAGQPTATATSSQVGRDRATPTAQPGDTAALIQTGIEVLGEECSGDAEAAKALFERALEQDPNALLAQIGLARCAMCSGDVPTAFSALEKAIATAPEDARPYFWRGQLWFEEGDAEQAYADLEQALALDPNFAQAYLYRAIIAMWPFEDYDQALADLDAAIELAPELAYAYLLRGQSYLWYADDADQALSDLTKFIELAPDLPDGYALRGEAYLDYLGDYEQAIPDYAAAIERDDTEPFYYKQRARAYEQLGEWEQAVDDYARAIDLVPDGELYLRLGMALYVVERYEEAIESLDQAILMGGITEGAAHHGQGWVYHAMERYEDAIEAYDRAADFSWEDYAWPFFEESPIPLDRARAYRELGRFEEALGDLDALIAAQEWWFRPYVERALTYRAMGQERQARQDLLAALELADSEEWVDEIARLIDAAASE